MKKALLQRYCILVDFLGAALGPDYEIVLQDLSNAKNSVVAIVNGHISGREIGSPLTDTALRHLSSKEYEKNDFLSNYQATTADGRILRGSTMFIKDEKGTPVGMLCINFDDSRFIELHDKVLSIAHPMDFLQKYSTHTIQNMDKLDVNMNSVEKIVETLTPDIDSLMKQMYQKTIADSNMPSDRLNQEERIEIITKLNEQGFFKLKSAVQYLARQLGCSAASIYRYLNDIKS